MPPTPPPDELTAGLLAGQRLAVSRAISQVEDDDASARAILRAVYPHSGRAHIVGITGAPGTGKSTLVTGLVQSYRQTGLTVAVLAVDPTSPFSGGALLGDRVRMTRLSGDEGVFIRSMATRGALGGLARATADASLLLDAAGFDRILVETVGVGQAEVEVAALAHTTVVVEAPGLGDEVQAIKAGILEVGDIFVVNKSDRPSAQRTVSALEMMVQMDGGGPRRQRHHGQLMEIPGGEEESDGGRWQPRVLQTVAIGGNSVEHLREEIERHRVWLAESGEIAVRERARLGRTLDALVQATLARRLRAALTGADLESLVEAVRRREIDPYSAADQLLARLES